MRGSICASIFLGCLVYSNWLYAAPYSQACSSFASPEAYARVAAVYCLRHRRSAKCHQEAAEYFRKCSYSGDFEQLSQNARTDFLKMYVLSFVPRSATVHFEK